jgi:hypothetical protein
MTVPEDLARRLFTQAIAEDRCSELLEALFNGASATIDVSTGRLVIASADALAQMLPPEVD